MPIIRKPQNNTQDIDLIVSTGNRLVSPLKVDHRMDDFELPLFKDI